MKEIVVQDSIKIEDMIFEVRGKQVMIDRNLAALYQIETRVLIQKVKRNIERFPKEFFFQMTEQEFIDWKSHIVMSERDKIGLRRAPYVFTEQGVAMLSAIINTEVAVGISIKIINTFVAMRKYISNNLLNSNSYSDMLKDHEGRIKALENTFSKFDTFSNELFFEGQIYDAHSLLLDIFNTSKKSIIIIDNYISKELLDVLSKTNKDITIYTKNIDEILIKKYQKQYNNVTININNSFHDRFIIIDNKTLYHCGASFKDLGKKCFAINKIDNINIIKDLTKTL